MMEIETTKRILIKSTGVTYVHMEDHAKLEAENAKLREQHEFAEGYRKEFLEIIGNERNAHWGDICVIIVGELARLREQLATYEADMRAASGELVVPLPEPGTDMAKVIQANRVLKDEVGRLQDRPAEWTLGEPLKHGDVIAEGEWFFQRLPGEKVIPSWTHSEITIGKSFVWEYYRWNGPKPHLPEPKEPEHPPVPKVVNREELLGCVTQIGEDEVGFVTHIEPGEPIYCVSVIFSSGCVDVFTARCDLYDHSEVPNTPDLVKLLEEHSDG